MRELSEGKLEQPSISTGLRKQAKLMSKSLRQPGGRRNATGPTSSRTPPCPQHGGRLLIYSVTAPHLFPFLIASANGAAFRKSETVAGDCLRVIA
jgi:hypothetical protein